MFAQKYFHFSILILFNFSFFWRLLMGFLTPIEALSEKSDFHVCNFSFSNAISIDRLNLKSKCNIPIL